MLRELPINYAMVFFLGMLVYAPITLIANGRYRAGLKCAAAMCGSLLMLSITARLATAIYPALSSSTADPVQQQHQPNSSTAPNPKESLVIPKFRNGTTLHYFRQGTVKHKLLNKRALKARAGCSAQRKEY
jgi:hypothetical protein